MLKISDIIEQVREQVFYFIELYKIELTILTAIILVLYYIYINADKLNKSYEKWSE